VVISNGIKLVGLLIDILEVAPRCPLSSEPVPLLLHQLGFEAIEVFLELQFFVFDLLPIIDQPFNLIVSVLN